MKKIIVGAAFGIAVSVASSYGQGFIWFENYNATTDAIVTTCKFGVGIVPADDSLKAALFYGFGTITGSENGPLPESLVFAGVSQSFNPAAPGYFSGGIVRILGYVSGPITFSLAAYNGADYADSTFRGHSALFTLPSIATGIQLPGQFGPGLQPFYAGPLTCISEPCTVALASLGFLSLLVFGPHKKRVADTHRKS